MWLLENQCKPICGCCRKMVDKTYLLHGKMLCPACKKITLLRDSLLTPSQKWYEKHKRDKLVSFLIKRGISRKVAEMCRY